MYIARCIEATTRIKWPALRQKLRDWLLLGETDDSDDKRWQLSVFKIIVVSSLLLCLLIAVHSLVTAWALGVYSVIVIVLGYYVALIATLHSVRRRPLIGATLLLVMVYVCGLLMLLGIGDRALSDLGVVFLYVAPVIAWIYFGMKPAFALMALNSVGFLYILPTDRTLIPLGFDSQIPNSHAYLHALLFLFFNIIVPLALFRVFSALNASLKRNQKINRHLQLKHRHYEALFENAGSAKLLCSRHGGILKASQKACTLLGNPMTDKERMPALRDLFTPADHDMTIDTLLEQARQRSGVEAEFLTRTRSSAGSTGREVVLAPQWIGDCLLVSIRDISTLRSMQRELLARERSMAPDALTRLPTVDHLGARWPRLLERRGDLLLALASVRLNNLRSVNEKFGQLRGDGLIRCMAEQLARQQYPGVQAYRLRGPVFLLLITGARTTTQVKDTVGDFIQALPRRYLIDGCDIDAHIEAGVAIARDTDPTMYPLLHRSERALEMARRSHLGVPVLFDDLRIGDLQREADIELALPGCIERGELHLNYQPKVDGDGAICGLEALLRWRSRELGVISPAEFIPVAERIGKIHALSHFVIELACYQQRLWLDTHGKTWPVAINLSGIDLQREDLPALIFSAMRRNALEPSLLDLEITETGLIENNAMALRNLHDLMLAGFNVAIDDFGTGYSSLKKLSEFSVSAIKIDRSFTAAIGENRRSERIMQLMLMLMLARTMRCEVIAEGVETSAQLQFLIDNGCRQFQGYLFYPPQTPEAIDRLLENY